MSRPVRVVPGSKNIDLVPLPCRHHRTYVERGSGDTTRFCDVCRCTYRCEVKESSWQNAWLVQFHHMPTVAPVEPAATPLAAETFPGTGRRGRGGNLAPAGNTLTHKGDAA